MQRRVAIGVTVFLAALLVYFNSVWNYTPIPSVIGSYLYQIQEAQEYAAFTAELLASPAAATAPVPVVGVRARDVSDTYGAARSQGRSHEGTDIFARRGTPVVSATEGIVARMGEGELGGKYVFIFGPAGERYYYAHLDSIDPLLKQGMRVGTSTLLGRVGTTGNASGTPPHLHFGIYGTSGALNPYERLRPQAID